MGIDAENAVAHIIVMRDLNMIEQNHILQLDRVAHNAVFPHQRASPDKGSMTHFRACTDNAGSAEIGCGHDFGCFMNPDMLRNLVIFVCGKRFPESENQVLNAGKCFPGICKLRQILSRHGFREIIQLCNGQTGSSVLFPD